MDYGEKVFLWIFCQRNHQHLCTREVPLGDHHKTLIVIPSFNEETSIGQVLEDVKQNAPEIPVLVVNDGSVDHTAQIAEEHGAQSNFSSI